MLVSLPYSTVVSHVVGVEVFSLLLRVLEERVSSSLSSFTFAEFPYPRRVHYTAESCVVVALYQMYIGSVGRYVDAIAGSVRRGSAPWLQWLS